jgi:trans-2,3-dihydro-3-hydroxyanthranilate isomerase
MFRFPSSLDQENRKEARMARQFYTLDVFTEKALSGNPLAVVTQAEGLDGSRMQAIAREFNLSETVFVLPPADPAHIARLRIFTPVTELTFAGHPTVGTAVLLAQLQGLEHSELVLEEELGPVPVTLQDVNGSGGHAVFTAPALPQATGPAPDSAVLARVLGLPESAIGFDGYLPALVAA